MIPHRLPSFVRRSRTMLAAAALAAACVAAAAMPAGARLTAPLPSAYA